MVVLVYIFIFSGIFYDCRVLKMRFILELVQIDIKFNFLGIGIYILVSFFIVVIFSKG